jgi:general secretion pathway protein K
MGIDLYRAKKGSILLIALWSLFMLASLAVILGYQVRQKLALVKRLNERDSLSLICEAGVRTALAGIRGDPDQKGYNCLSDHWSSNPAFNQMQVGDGLVSIGNPPVYGLVDEERKVNINKADQPVMARLFRVCGLEEQKATDLSYSIIDWRDADSYLSVPLGSAEDSYYRDLKNPYEAKNADFETLDELLLVRGMDENVFKKIRNYITIYGNGKININTAQRPVLIAAGLSPETADLLEAFRNGKDGVPGTTDDGVFTDIGDLTAKLSAENRLSDAQLTELSTLAPLSGVVSQYFTVTAVASLGRGVASQSVTAVISARDGIVYWSEE